MTRSIEPGVGNGTHCESNGCIKLDIYTGAHLAEPLVGFHSTETGTVMQARASEVIKFFAEVKNGEWDHVITDVEIVLGTDSLKDVVDAAMHKAR